MAAVQSPLQAPVSAGAAATVSPAGGVVPSPAVQGAQALGATAPFGTSAVPAAVATTMVPADVSGAAAAPTTGAAAATTGAQRLTTLAPGGQQADADLVEKTLGTLRQSAAGSQIVDRLLAVGARVNVISDEEFAAMGQDGAHAFFDPKADAMYLRRSDLASAEGVQFAAVALAHEGTHLLDDVGKVSTQYLTAASQRVAAAGGTGTAAGAEAQRQAMFELTMIKEARAFTFAGQVARELGVSLPADDPTSIAAAGGNDQATYAKVWNELLHSSYNTERRSATVRNF